MKHSFLILVLFVFFGLSCDKNEDSTSCEPEVGGVLEDEILFTALAPEISVTSIDTFLIHPFGCLYTLPDDSTAMAEFDLDQDGTADFKVLCQSWYEHASSSSPCVNFNRAIWVAGLTSQNQVLSSEPYPVANFLSLNDTINEMGEWINDPYIAAKALYVPFGGLDNGDYYVGLRVGSGEDYYYGWLYFSYLDYVVTLKSYAVNNTFGNSILVGQVE